jgi:hypothetical protein
MTEQDSTSGRLAQSAAENGPSAPAGERPASGAERRTDPSEPNPAANQRADEHTVESGSTAEGGVGNADDREAAAQSGAGQGTPPRRRDASSPGSSAAAAGEVPVPAVETSQADAAGGTESATHDRPVTGVHRPSAPSGEVSPR